MPICKQLATRCKNMPSSPHNPTLSIIIVNWNTAALLRNCLHSLAADTTLDAEIIVVDNASSDESVALVKQEFPTVRLIENSENLGFARANNIGIQASTSNYVALLNSDTLVPNATFAALIAQMEQSPTIGAISPQLRRADGSAQSFAFGYDPSPSYLIRRAIYALLLRRPLHDWAIIQPCEVEWVSGACLLVRRAAINQVGMLDEQIFMYFEDNDWCRRIRQAGWQVVYYPLVYITHIGGQSIKRNPAAQQSYQQALIYFYKKHYGRLAQTWLQAGLRLYQWFLKLY